MNRIGDDHPYMTVNSRAGIPAAVLSFIPHFYRKNIFFSVPEIFADVVPKTGVTIRVLSEWNSIEPDFCIHIYTIKLKEALLVFLFSRHHKMFAVPSRSA